MAEFDKTAPNAQVTPLVDQGLDGFAELAGPNSSNIYSEPNFARAGINPDTVHSYTTPLPESGMVLASQHGADHEPDGVIDGFHAHSDRMTAMGLIPRNAPPADRDEPVSAVINGQRVSGAAAIKALAEMN